MNKKHFIFNICIAAISVAALSSCSDDDSPESSGNIVFKATSYNPLAPDDAAEIINGSVMVVTALTTGDDASTVMKNVAVSKNDGAWSYFPAVKWPAEEVSFYGYMPQQGVDADISQSSHALGYECRGTDDLQYALTPGMKRSSGAVNLNYRHALSRVEFNFACADNDVNILVNTLSVHGLIKESTFTYPTVSTAIGMPFIEGKWTPQAIDASDLLGNSYVIAEAEPQPQMLSSDFITINTTMCYYFIPQQLNQYNGSKGAYARVTYQVVDKATGKVIWPADDASGERYGAVTFSLNINDVTAWNSATSYKYNVSLVTPSPSSPGVKDVKIVATNY